MRRPEDLAGNTLRIAASEARCDSSPGDHCHAAPIAHSHRGHGYASTSDTSGWVPSSPDARRRATA